MKPATLLLETLPLLSLAAPAFPQATFVQVGNDLGNHSRLWGADSLGAGFGAGEVWLQGSGARHAVRWSGAAPLEDLGDLPGGLDDSSGEAISDDGSVVVGVSESSSGPEAFRWEPGTGIVGLGDLPGGQFRSHATGVSADGAWVCGGASDDAGWQAVRWDGLGAIEVLGSLPYGSGQAQATAISADGGVIVGLSDAGSDWFPFRWTAAGGLQPLGHQLSGMIAGRAEGVSDDGQVVVGLAIVPSGGSGDYLHPFRYTVGGAMEPLGFLPGGYYAADAMDCSGDGSVVVGGNLWSGGESRAFLWDAAGGIRSLQEVLEVDHGLDLGGFVPWVASAISADGRTITGYGVNHKGYYRGFVATLPSPCPDPVSYCAALPNSSGTPAAIGHGGSTSIADNSFTLIATGGVPSQFGLFYYGPNRIQLPWGDGYRCVGGGINRLNPAFQSDAAGISARWVDFAHPSASAITAGSTWNFQHWYRDPSGPGGSGFNLSDALEVTFCL